MKIHYHKIIALPLLMLACQGHAQSTAQKIGSNPTIKDASAVLELESTNRGMLFTRVALTSTTAPTPITSPANGLTVFNTATNGTAPDNVSPGYYFWSTASLKWIRVIDDLTNNDWSLTGNANTSPSTNFLGTKDAQDLVIRTNDTEKMRIATGGNVGIGTNNPQAKLDVNGDAFITDKVFPRTSGSGRSAHNLVVDNITPYTNSLGMRIYDGTSNAHLSLYGAQAGASVIQAYGTTSAARNAVESSGTEGDLLLLPYGGNISIGASFSPTARLELNGSLKVKTINVTTNNYPISTTDFYINVTGGLTVRLPLADGVGAGRVLYISTPAAGGCTVAVALGSGNLIYRNGSSGVSSTTINREMRTFIASSNGHWYVN